MRSLRTNVSTSALFAIACVSVALPAQSSLEFEEAVVAGGSQDFMEVRHLVLRGSQREIGQRLAEVARERCGATPWPVRDALTARVQREYFRDHWPHHHERMVGAAAAFGAAVDDPNQNFAKIAFHVSDFFGCSVAYYPAATTADGRSVMSRNLDFTAGTMTGRRPTAESPAALSKPFVIESYPDDGYASLFLGSMDLLGSAFDGINEKGLTAALLTDRELIDRYNMEPRRDLAVGLSEIQLVRYLLETCANVEEAKAAILRNKHYYGFVPCHYIIGDRDGNAVVWEASPGRNRDWFVDNPGEPLVTTNFMLHLHEDPMSVDPSQKGLGSIGRYQRMCRAIDAVDGKVDRDTICAINASVQPTRPGPPPSVPYAPSRTLWHALYYPDDASLEIDFYLGEESDGPGRPPRIKRSGYLKFQLKR